MKVIRSRINRRSISTGFVTLVVLCVASDAWSQFESAQTRDGKRSKPEYVGLTNAQAESLEMKANALREPGMLESASMVELRAPITGIIALLTREGSAVKKGDVLAQLESSAIKDDLNDQKVKHAIAKAKIAFARTNVDNFHLELDSSRDFALRAKEVAELRLELFSGKTGEYETLRSDLQDQLLAAEKKEAAFNLALQHFKNAAEGEARQAFDIATAKSKIAETQAETSILERKLHLHQMNKKLHLAELQLAIAEQKALLSSKTAVLQEKLKRAEADLATADLESQLEEGRLNELEKKLQACVLRAPHDGILLYSVPASRRGNSGTIEEGVQVMERQPIVRVADMSRLQVATRINETRIGRVKIGQKASIRFGALPDKEFVGKVTGINSIPESTSFLNADVKKYKVTVSVDDPSPGLRIGMTALVEIR